MSQRDNFFGGFLVGAVLGGVVGGILGVTVASRISQNDASNEDPLRLDNKPNKPRLGKSKGERLRVPTEQSIEAARRGLEDKIAQLNDAIDDVRQQLGGVNGSSKEERDEVGLRDS